MGHTGLFKIASGDDIAKAPSPGTFDLKVCHKGKGCEGRGRTRAGSGSGSGRADM